ncbi:Ankyrin repeat and EF-hand domain-containing protein 1 [Apiospora saccharicola]|uniref:Ankyrin repeat and EF-hand domain-containing protein 1 n=1 Tax=Apiospora saccharicola TaxID=335842 RepID=A0ABR1U2L4_9PEZI
MNDIRTPTQRRILLWACATGYLRVVKRILEAGLNPNVYFQYEDRYWKTDYEPGFYFTYDGLTGAFSGEPDTEDHLVTFWQPLHVAVRHGHCDIVDILLDKNTWVDAPSFRFSPIERPLVRDHCGRYTPLHLTICEGHEDIARTLILKGASIYVDHSIQTQEPDLYPERGRMSAFHLCAFKGMVPTAELLIDMGYGAAIDELDEYGCSPLMHAYHFKQDDFLHFLLAQGASPRINPNASCSVNFRCHKLLHQACWDNRWELVAKLCKHNTDPLEPDSEIEGLQCL